MIREEMLQRMSSRELAEWRAYDRMEPIGEPRADYRMGVLTSLIANTHRNSETMPEPFSPEDFMWRGPDALIKPLTEQEKERNLALKIVAALGKFERKEG